tara:strand:- start:16649 stop:17575 length:927 start_codon:yes stop_codon:yes gene_type:complete
MKKTKVILLLFILFVTFQYSKVFSKINNSVIISVGNQPITQLDLIKEMKIISIITNNKIDDNNKEGIKNIAVQALIKRKIKEIEIKKYNIQDYNFEDLNNLILKASQNIGTDENGLRQRFKNNNIDFNNLTKNFEIDLLWNTLIFELYKNKVALNMNEIEDKINQEIENTKEKRRFLLYEIEIGKTDNSANVKKVIDNIKLEGFENTAKKFSISKSSQYGGNIGWVNDNNLAKKVYQSIKDLKINEVSDPIYLDETILFIKKVSEKTFGKKIENIKDKVVKSEKLKKLQMFSNAHYSNLKKTTQINFL